MPSFVKDLHAPLLQLSPDDVMTLDDATKGVHVFGGIGSGKTSGAGKMLAGAFLRAGFGGLVTAVKAEEISLWQKYASEHGRRDSLLVFDEREAYNFLADELGRQGMAGIGTVVECLLRVLEAAGKVGASSRKGGEDPFWGNTTRQVLRYAVPTLYAAGGSFSIGDVIRFISTAPSSVADTKSKEWQRSSFMYQALDAAANAPKVAMDQGMLQNAVRYWGEEFPVVPEKTRGNMVVTVSSVLDRFRHGRLQRAFCDKTTVVPELSFHGMVILLAMPTLTWNEDGVIGQQLFKYMWQKSVLARNSLGEKHRERPVFLYSDEAQETVSPFDQEYQSLCRGSKACTVFMTQSLPTYYAKMSSDKPQDDAHGLVGKFGTHVFFSNSCPDTNEYASRMLGKVMKRHYSYNSGTSRNFNFGMNEGGNENSGSSSNYGSNYSNQGGGGGNSGSGHNQGKGVNWGANRGRSDGETESSGYSEHLEYAIEPGDFARALKTGGRHNNGEVTGIWFQSGHVFKKSGTNFFEGKFQQ